MKLVAFAATSQRLTNGPSTTPRRLPWGIWAASCGLTAVSVALLALSYQADLGPRWGPRGFLILFALMITTMGLVVSVRRPDNRIGWIYLAAGLLCAIQGFGEEYAAYALLARAGSLPGGVWWAWLQSWIWVPVVSLYLIYVPLLLPNGRLLSPCWRPVTWYAALATAVLAFFFATQPGWLANFYHVVNPLGVGGPDGLRPRHLGPTFGLMVVATLAAAVSLIQRVRQAAAMERQQQKWLAFACARGAAGMLASVIFGANQRPSEILVLGSILSRGL